MTIKTFYIKYIFLLVIPFVFSACNPARKLKAGEHLLAKNKIIDKDTKLDKSDMVSYLKQKPNREIFKTFRFHLWIHNLVNEEKVKRKREKFDKKLEAKNERRVAKGKKPKKSERQLFGEWVLDISEPPVVYDTMLTEKSRKQLKSFLNKKGYFESTVTDSVFLYETKRSESFL